MKRIRVIIPIILWIFPCITFWAKITKDSTIFDVMDLIKESIKFNSITIETNVPYSLVQDAINKYCPEDAITEAKWSVQSLINARWNLDTSDKNKALNERFNLLKKTIGNTKETNEYKYCKQNYLYFSLLKVTQELYKWDTEVKVNTTNDTKSTQKDEIKTQSTKNETTTTQTHGSAKNNLNFNFNHNTSWLPINARNSFYLDTERYLQDTIADLYAKNILNYSDIQRLNNKINVTYLQTCKTTEWDFRMTRNKSTGKYTFKEINLIIAYCETNNTPQKHQRHVQQILAHELWHYIYFFRDSNPSAFSEICRNNGKINCLSSEFVTNYARKSPEEDYAESFAYRYLNSKKNNNSNKSHNSPNDNNPINQRERHFERLFEEEKDDDDDDDERSKIK